MRILLLEDDRALSEIVYDYLSGYYDMEQASTADGVLSLVEQAHYDLFIFDINIPGKNGITLLKELRSFKVSTPAIIITGYEDTEHLKSAFDAGAHDYIRKPFSLEELLLRIENTKRLFNIECSGSVQVSENCRYDPGKKTLKCGGEFQPLAPKEAAMLEYFLARPGRTVSSEELVRNLWDFDHQPSDATVRSHIRRLRELIGSNKITTVHGIGYRYE